MKLLNSLKNDIDIKEERRLRNKAKHDIWTSNNKERLKQLQINYCLSGRRKKGDIKYFAKKREIILEKNRLYRINNSQKISNQIKERRKRNPEKFIEYAKIPAINLTDSYVLHTMDCTGADNMPADIIEAKRTIILIHRFCWDKFSE